MTGVLGLGVILLPLGPSDCKMNTGGGLIDWGFFYYDKRSEV